MLGCTKELEFGCQAFGEGAAFALNKTWPLMAVWAMDFVYLQKADQFIWVDRVCYKQLHLLATSSSQSWGNVSLEDLPYLGFIVSLLW